MWCYLNAYGRVGVVFIGRCRCRWEILSNREYEYECLHINKTEVINLNDFWYYDSITVLDVDV